MVAQSSDLPHAAGCVVYRETAGGPLFLLIRDKYGFWTLPKGHLDPGEDAAGAAAREVLEETGVSGALGPFVGEIRYPVRNKRGETYTKRVQFFLMRTEEVATSPQAGEGITEAGWFPAEEALAKNGYDQVRAILASGIELARRDSA